MTPGIWRSALKALPLLCLAACQSPEAAYFSNPASARIGIVLADDGVGAARLGPSELEAYRSAIQRRFSRHLATGSEPQATLKITFNGIRIAAPANPTETLVSAALTRNAVVLGLSLASLGSSAQEKLSSLGYPIRVPDASFVVLLPSASGLVQGIHIEENAIILAHQRLMHGDRGAESRLGVEAEAFASALESQVHRTFRWPPKAP